MHMGDALVLNVQKEVLKSQSRTKETSLSLPWLRWHNAL